MAVYRDSTEDYWHMSWGPEDKSLAEYVSGTSSARVRHEVAATNSFKEQNQPLPKVPFKCDIRKDGERGYNKSRQ